MRSKRVVGVWILSLTLVASQAFAAGFRLDCDGTGFEVPMVVSSADGLHAKVSAVIDTATDIAIVDYQNLTITSLPGGDFGVDLPRIPGVTGSFNLAVNQTLQGSVAMTSTDGTNVPYTGQVSCRRTR
jgi:hypothetical protein